jgi:4'-phosphopantetheinyl transferase EntD
MRTLYVESEEFAAEARALFNPIARRDTDLARRLKRASDDIVEHVQEGMCSTGRERKREYAAARKCALEALACIHAATSVGYLPGGDLGLGLRVKALVERLDGIQKAA